MSETPAEELYLRGYRSASKTWNGLLRWLPVSLPAEDDVRYIRADLHDAQAAEIERLRKQHGLWHETSIPQLYAENASQAAEIAALKEREIMRLAGISTAAQGYFKDGESIHTDYDTVALRDVTALYRKYEALRAENAALREGLPVPPRNEYWAQGEYGHD